MLRRLLCVVFLGICLNLLIGLANEPGLRAADRNPRPISHENGEVVEAAVTAVAPVPETASVVPEMDLAGFLTHPLLVTSEPVLIQLHVAVVAHQSWQRFGLADVAPFCSSRSLPILV